MYKIFYTLLLLFTLPGCNRNDTGINNNVYITFLKSDFIGTEIQTSNLEPPQYFSEDFWDFFIKKFPQSTSIIFYSHLINKQPSIILKDSSLIIGMIDYGTMSRLQNNLPETIDGNEKINRFSPKFFFEQNHSQEIKSNIILIPLITVSIRKDYVRFLQIINNKSSPPIFIYKRDFLIQIEKVYKQERK